MTDPLRTFHERFGSSGPTHVARSPGRVNLIGEHIDYVGLAVLPMAVEQRVSVYFRARDDHTVRVVNLDPRFQDLAFELSADIAPGAPGHWGNYVKAAAQALSRRGGPLRGFDAVIGSELPDGAGLSSSSALVIGSALTLVQGNGLEIETLELAELMAEAERYVGTRGGGMDQAVCLAARKGAACRIDFAPVRISLVDVPSDWRFVVASSLIRAEKSGAAQAAYNRRTEQCADALAMVCDALEIDGEGSYRALLDAIPVEELVAAASAHLPDDLGRRFKHVVTEGARVARAASAMHDEDLPVFGRLMNESHASLRDDYQVSCPELNELTEIARSAGAAGARLTGAGFGGCIVAACRDAEAPRIIAALTEKFYDGRSYEGDLSRHLFVAQPGSGARVEPITGTDLN